MNFYPKIQFQIFLTFIIIIFIPLQHSFLIKNEVQEIYDIIKENIKKTYKILGIEDNDFLILKIGDHLLSNGGPYKIEKTIKCRRTKFKTYKLPLTVINNFHCGIIKVDVDIY